MNVIILAAGMGKRMHSDLPKVLHQLSGKPMLGRVLDIALALQPQQVCVVFGHGGVLVPDWVSTNYGDQCLLVEQARQLGTGHAVLQATPFLDDSVPTLILYGDVPLTRVQTLRKLCSRAGSESLGILTLVLSNPTGYGRIVRDELGKILEIVEQKDATVAQQTISEVNTGMLVAPTTALKRWLAKLSNHNAQGEYYLTDIVAQACAEAYPIVSVQPDDDWEVMGVNCKQQLAHLERITQRNQARDLLEAGVTLSDPERIDLRGKLVCGRDVRIDVGCVFEGSVVLGDGVQIGPYCVLKDVEVAAKAVVHAYSHLEGASVGPNAKIGPYARLRPGTVLGQDVHIGNFVEVKKSTIGVGSKANHLSYIGDAAVGARVNVGAGTITCNYDGVNKFQTIIEDDAFIGSDSQLVAPVRVGQGATLGAGTTLTRNAPAGQLTLSRAKQLSIPGWKRPSKKG